VPWQVVDGKHAMLPLGAPWVKVQAHQACWQLCILKYLNRSHAVEVFEDAQLPACLVGLDFAKAYDW
jgi:hypothetical protein